MLAIDPPRSRAWTVRIRGLSWVGENPFPFSPAARGEGEVVLTLFLLGEGSVQMEPLRMEGKMCQNSDMQCYPDA